MKTKLFLTFNILSLFCLGQFSATLMYNGNPMTQPNFNMGPCFGNCIDVSVNVSGGTPPYTFTWHNNPSVNDSVTYCKPVNFPVSNRDSLYVIVKDAFNNEAFACSVIDIDYLSWQYLCMASVDSVTGKNLLTWNQSSNPTIVSYKIYKETTTVSVYSSIATLPRSNFSTFIDPSSNPLQNAARYKITAIDTCGTESNIIAYNLKTIHLSLSQGAGSSWNLNWDDAEGFSITKYRVWRKLINGTPVLIDSIQSSLHSYTDVSAPTNVQYYFLEALTTANCNPSGKTTSVGTSSFSNFGYNPSIGLPENGLSNKTSIFPNPTTSELNIALPGITEELKLQLFDVNGRGVLETSFKTSIQLDVKELQKGVYFLRITGSDINLSKRVVLVE